jgi:hypothetical protein
LRAARAGVLAARDVNGRVHFLHAFNMAIRNGKGRVTLFDASDGTGSGIYEGFGFQPDRYGQMHLHIAAVWRSPGAPVQSQVNVDDCRNSPNSELRSVNFGLHATGNAGVYRGPGNGQGRPTVGARQVAGASFRRGGYVVGRTPSGSGRP